MKKLVVAMALLMAGCASTKPVEKVKEPAAVVVPEKEDRLRSQYRVINAQTGKEVDLIYDGCYSLVIDSQGIGLKIADACRPWK